MRENQKSPFLAVHANEDSASAEAQLNAPVVSQEELELQQQEAELAAKRRNIQLQKDQAAQEAKKKLNAQLEKTRAAANNFKKQALATSDPVEKKALYGWVTEAEVEVQRLETELGIVRPDAQVKEEPGSWFQRNRTLTALLQVIGIMVAIYYFYAQFQDFGDIIRAANENLPMEQKLNPYDKTSIQKLFYEKLVVFVDLPLAFLVALLLVPFVAFYVLPFVKSKRDFCQEFYEELTPWQRTVISTAIFLGLLFFLALSHNVKP